MKRSLVPAAICSVFLLQPLCADFEKWTRGDGKSAELNLVDVKQVNGELSAEFETKAGKRVSMKLSELADADQVRVKNWNPGKNVRTKFKEMSGDVADGKPRTTFSFEMQSKGLFELVYRDEGNVIRPGAPEVLRFTSGGEPVKFESCTADLERDPFNEASGGDADPFGPEGKGGKAGPKLDAPGILHVILNGVAMPPNAADCEFEAKLFYRELGPLQEIEGMIEVSKKLDDLKFQQLGPYKVALKPWALWDERKQTEAQEIEKNGPAGYSVVLSEDSDQSLAPTTYLVVSNKRHEGMMVEAKGSRFKVVISHHPVVRELPFIVRKAAAEAGVK